MPSLKTLVCIFVVLSIAVSTANAKTSYAYVANNSGNSVSVVNLTTNAVVATIPVGSFPYGVAVNQAGTLAYVTNAGANTVSIISTATKAVTGTLTLTGLSGPMDIALTPNGKTAYVSCGNNTVAVINTVAKTFKTITVQNPIGLAVTPNGAFVYVVSSGPGKVLAISTLTNSGLAFSRAAIFSAMARGLAFASLAAASAPLH